MNKKDSSKVKEEDKGEEDTRKRVRLRNKEVDYEFLTRSIQSLMKRLRILAPKTTHKWKVISWKLHSSSGVHTLMTDEGLVVHMLIEKKYPLKKEIVVQMLKLKLESEEESTMALELIRFIKKVLADLESKELFRLVVVGVVVVFVVFVAVVIVVVVVVFVIVVVVVAIVVDVAIVVVVAADVVVFAGAGVVAAAIVVVAVFVVVVVFVIDDDDDDENLWVMSNPNDN
ncbi:hypothetical protein Tco_1370124 [Tanacetum coccineum]